MYDVTPSDECATHERLLLSFALDCNAEWSWQWTAAGWEPWLLASQPLYNPTL